MSHDPSCPVLSRLPLPRTPAAAMIRDATREAMPTSTTATARTGTRTTRKLAASKSLPNLVVREKPPSTSTTTSTTSTSASKKRRLSSPSSPNANANANANAKTRSRPKRAPLTDSQQTTLDKFLAGGMNGRKDTVNLVDNTAPEDKQRPAKKARLDRNADAEREGDAEREESPDPLHAITPIARPARKETRARKPTPALPNKRKTVDPPTADKTKTKANEGQKGEKRSLRSHDGGSRSRSELAAYFPNYEQIISLEPVVSEEVLVSATVVTLLDDLSEPVVPSEELGLSPSRTRRQQRDSDLVSAFGNPLLELQGVERVDLAQLDTGSKGGDPLGDDVYFKAHRRHERQEKQLRNIERERAQHEKIQLDRLLDELQGHDWLRVMGISGVTDTEKKLYEPKRDYFVKEVCALIDKFRVWREEEKRRKLERERVAIEAAEAEAEAEDEEEEEEIKHPSSDVQSYDSSEVDAAAARQLIQEARSATETVTSPNTPPKQTQRRRLVDALTATPPKSRPHHPEMQEEEKPFVSFYPKRRLRDAAFASSRRNGRNRSAFGQPLPEMDEEREFRLPRDILTPELVHAMERKRRRLKRESRG